jgi:hypothetical protein
MSRSARVEGANEPDGGRPSRAAQPQDDAYAVAAPGQAPQIDDRRQQGVMTDVHGDSVPVHRHPRVEQSCPRVQMHVNCEAAMAQAAPRLR